MFRTHSRGLPLPHRHPGQKPVAYFLALVLSLLFVNFAQAAIATDPPQLWIQPANLSGRIAGFAMQYKEGTTVMYNNGQGWVAFSSSSPFYVAMTSATGGGYVGGYWTRHGTASNGTFKYCSITVTRTGNGFIKLESTYDGNTYVSYAPVRAFETPSVVLAAAEFTAKDAGFSDGGSSAGPADMFFGGESNTGIGQWGGKSYQWGTVALYGNWDAIIGPGTSADDQPTTQPSTQPTTAPSTQPSTTMPAAILDWANLPGRAMLAPDPDGSDWTFTLYWLPGHEWHISLPWSGHIWNWGDHADTVRAFIAGMITIAAWGAVVLWVLSDLQTL